MASKKKHEPPLAAPADASPAERGNPGKRRGSGSAKRAAASARSGTERPPRRHGDASTEDDARGLPADEALGEGAAEDEAPEEEAEEDETLEVGADLAGGLPDDALDPSVLADPVIDAEAELLDDDSLPMASSAHLSGAPSSRAITRADPLQAYMQQVQRHPLLVPDEEHRLAVSYVETGNVEAAARLVTANLRLVVKLAYQYRRAYRNMMDLIQEGNIGLMQAVKRYDPYRGVKLSSYAAWWIRAYMLRYILNNWRMVKLGTTQAQRKLFFNLNKEKARLTAMGIEPSHEQLAKNLEVGVGEVREMDRRLAAQDSSLDVPVGDADGRQTSRLDLMATDTAGPDTLTESAELSELVKQHLDIFRETLAGKDLEIFDRRIVADSPLTLQQLGDAFGVSRERVRQLEARITARLREHLREALGDAVAIGS